MNSAFVVTQRVAQDYDGPWTGDYMQLGDIVSVFCPECRHENPVEHDPHDDAHTWRCEACGHEWQFPKMEAWHVVEEESG